MARLYTCGFGLLSTTVGVELHSVNGVVVIATGPSGRPEMHVTSLVSGTSQRASIRHVNFPTAGPHLGRAYFTPVTRPSADNTIARYSSGGVPYLVKLKSDGKIVLADDVGTIGTSVAALTNAQRYRIGMTFDASGGAGAGVARVLVDGVAVVEATDRTFGTTTVQQMDVGGNLSGEAQTVGEWWWSDLAVNDNTGSVENDLPGDGIVAYFRPTANGDTNVGVTRGGADSGADWSQLSEVTPNDATDYVELAGTTGAVWVNCTDTAALSIGGAYVIKFVAVGGRVTLASAGTGNWFPSLKSQASGVVLDGTPVTLAATTWATNDDSSGLQQYKVTSYTDPQTGGAWTAAKLDTMQIGAKTTDGSPATRVSTLWGIIEYQVVNVNIPSVLNAGITGGLSTFDGGLR